MAFGLYSLHLSDGTKTLLTRTSQHYRSRVLAVDFAGTRRLSLYLLPLASPSLVLSPVNQVFTTCGRNGADLDIQREQVV